MRKGNEPDARRNQPTVAASKPPMPISNEQTTRLREVLARMSEQNARLNELVGRVAKLREMAVGPFGVDTLGGIEHESYSMSDDFTARLDRNAATMEDLEAHITALENFI